MSKKHIRLDTKYQKGIYEQFQYLSGRYGEWDVWSDFITMSACELCPSDRQKREEEYAKISKRYPPEEMNRFAEMLAFTIKAFIHNPYQDFLGDLFMRFDLGNTWKGQFFTPYEVCRCISLMTAGDLKAQLEQQSWISICDPTIGGGAMLIAFTEECVIQEINYQTDVLFVGQDIDRIAAMMSFVQLSLLGCPGYIIVGNSLLNPTVGPDILLPVQKEGEEIWYTPMYFSERWRMRRRVAKMKLIAQPCKGQERTSTKGDVNRD